MVRRALRSLEKQASGAQASPNNLFGPGCHGRKRRALERPMQRLRTQRAATNGPFKCKGARMARS